MTVRIDMYLLRSDAVDNASLACRLIGKAWPAHQAVQVACADQQQCQALDELLWQLPENRFIGHAIKPNKLADHAPVQISTQTDTIKDDTVLVELRSSNKVADNCQQFARVLDIVSNSDDARANARQRYTAYRQLTTELHTHELS